MELRGFMHEMILTELEDAVGVENVSHSSDQKLAYGTDYFWLARMTVDKGGNPACAPAAPKKSQRYSR